MALRKNLCKNNQPQKKDFVVRAADRSLSFLFQYKLNTAVCQIPDAKYPDATERSAVKSGYFAPHQFSLSGYIISSSPSTLPQSRSGIVQSMNSAGGRCHDNARCESVWARMKEELFYNRGRKSENYTIEALKTMVWRYFMSYWSNRRICSAIGGIPPAVKRRRFYSSLTIAA